MAVNLGLGLEGTHVLVTGGSGLIGTEVVRYFLEAGANVTSLDLRGGNPLQGYDRLLDLTCDITDEEGMQKALQHAYSSFGPVECCVALASMDLSVLQHHASLADMSQAQWRKTLDVNVGGTFLTAREWLKGVRKAVAEGRHLRNVNLIIIGSESGWFGERTNADYSAAKSAVQVGLLQSLKADAPRVYGKARVNAVAPGPVDTARFKEECKADPNQLYADAQATVALARPVPVDAVARSILFLASDVWSSHVHGQVLNVDSGKQGKLMWLPEELKR